LSAEALEISLREFIHGFENVIVAFSGGVDSSYLSFVCHQELGAKAHCVTALSPAVSSRQKHLAHTFAKCHQLNWTTVSTQEMEDANYTSNPTQRCYFCKQELYQRLEGLRCEWEVDVVMDGTNKDDLGDFRPGLRAIKELDVVSPLSLLGFSKEDIRDRSRHWGLESAELPAMPCLSSRFPYGTEITTSKLGQVEQAEEFIRELGFKTFRVRHHEELARIEIDQGELTRALDERILSEIRRRLLSVGYRYVTLDLSGFQSGSLNRRHDG
jgi:uncharacterized protein